MTSWRDELMQDWAVNRESTKSQVIMVTFRFAHRVQRTERLPKVVRGLCVTGYKVLTTWLLGVELPPETEVGPELRIIHPQAIVFNAGTKVGARCIVRASTTIGNVMDSDGTASASPVIGDDVEMGAGVVVIGPITIGNGARIGAGSVVIRDVPGGAVAVGNPARILGSASG